jgi:acyl-CoA thioester hydrolase
MEESFLAGYPVVVVQAVVWGDMDSYRHVNNTVYFRYFENARLEYFRQMHWFEYEDETGIGPILSATQCRFRKPLTYPDTVSIGARISNIGLDRVTYDYLIVSHNLNAVAAEGQGTIVSYDYRNGKKVPLPDELRRRIEVLEAGKPMG